MIEEKKEESRNAEKHPRIPDFKGDGVAVWINTRENGLQYLSIRITGHNPIYANKNG